MIPAVGFFEIRLIAHRIQHQLAVAIAFFGGGGFVEEDVLDCQSEVEGDVESGSRLGI